jgi:hypothetical protein
MRHETEIDHIDPRWKEGRDYQLVCGLDCPLNLREEDALKNRSKGNRFLPWRWSRDELGVVPEEPGDLAWFLVGADIEKDVPGEWVLAEFLSDEWFLMTVGTDSRSFRTVNVESLQEGHRKWRESNPEEYRRSVENLIRSGQEWRKENSEEFSKAAREARKRVVENDPTFEARRIQAAIKGFTEWRETFSPDEWAEWNQMISDLTKEAMKNPEVRERCKEGGKAGGKITGNWKFQCTVTGKILGPGPLARWQKKRGIDPHDPENRIRIK